MVQCVCLVMCARLHMRFVVSVYDHTGKYLQCQSNETTSILTNYKFGENRCRSQTVFNPEVAE